MRKIYILGLVATVLGFALVVLVAIALIQPKDSRPQQAAPVEVEREPPALHEDAALEEAREVDRVTGFNAAAPSQNEPVPDPEETRPQQGASAGEEPGFDAKYKGMPLEVLKGHYDTACKRRLELARPILIEKMRLGLYEEYPIIYEPLDFDITKEIPDIKDNPMVLMTVAPLGDDRFVPRVVQLSPDETPEILQSHTEAQWLKARISDLAGERYRELKEAGK